MFCACLYRVFCFPCKCCSIVSKKCSCRTGGDNSVSLEKSNESYFGVPAIFEMERKEPLLSPGVTVEIEAMMTETASEVVINDTEIRLRTLDTEVRGFDARLRHQEAQIVALESQSMANTRDIRIITPHVKVLEEQSARTFNGGRTPTPKTPTPLDSVKIHERLSELTSIPPLVSEFEALFRVDKGSDTRLLAAMTAPTFSEDAYEHYPIYMKKVEETKTKKAKEEDTAPLVDKSEPLHVHPCKNIRM